MPDSDLRPMLLMVCSNCAKGLLLTGEFVDGCAICHAQGKFNGAEVGPPEPVRTREEMVEAGMRWVQASTDTERPMLADEIAAGVLIAAGVIEEEERDA